MIITNYGEAYNDFKDLSEGKEVYLDYGLGEEAKLLIEYIDYLENKIDRIENCINEWCDFACGQYLYDEEEQDIIEIIKENKIVRRKQL